MCLREEGVELVKKAEKKVKVRVSSRGSQATGNNVDGRASEG